MATFRVVRRTQYREVPIEWPWSGIDKPIESVRLTVNGETVYASLGAYFKLGGRNGGAHYTEAWTIKPFECKGMLYNGMVYHNPFKFPVDKALIRPIRIA